jgi:nucleotide-binding universal stress UspA family protein
MEAQGKSSYPQTVLVPLDGSMLAELALNFAESLARASGARLILLRVVVPYSFGGTNEAEARAKAIDEAERYLAGLVDRLVQHGIEAEATVLYGEAAPSIVDVARLRAVDLIAMCTHGRGGLGRWVYGSVAERVLATAPTAVLLVRAWQALESATSATERSRILVPLDGSPFAEQALPVAEQLAATLDAELVLLRVVFPPSPTFTQGWIVASSLSEEMEISESAARHYLEGIADRLSSSSLSVSIDVRFGAPASVIADTGADFAFLVMATHGRTGTERLMMGSVANVVVRRGDVPLVVVGPAAMEGAGSPA